MIPENNLQKWCSLFAEIPIPKNLLLTVLQNETADAERIIWQHFHHGWLPPRGANLPELRQMMPEIRRRYPTWHLDDATLLALCHQEKASELLKLYIIYNGKLSDRVLQELQTHPQKEEMLRLYAEWTQNTTPPL